ncbi:8553_t:CDS:2 [Scutellospora calospora]|uniref:8553_t:CDS:1 n=1 Tax=Scutellospora calospora TaxID=85575 RepID=A0ACA9NC81_9GLOM|nr:8553_t:CDS:2 [Scutellospora calospora]
MPKSLEKYYAVRVGNKTGIYKNWEDCKKQIHKYPDAYAGIGVFFKDNDPRNLSERLPGTNQTNNRAEIFAVIRAIEISKNDQNIIINTDSTYVINSYKVKNPKKNFDLVNRMNDLIKERKGKVIFKHVRGHSGIYENEKADRFAYLGSQKSHIELILPERKGTIKNYFK